MTHFKKLFSPFRLGGKGGTVLTFTKAIRFDGEGVWVKDPEGTRKLSGFDSMVISLGTTPDNGLVEPLKGAAPEVYGVDDAFKAGEVMEAVCGAEETALRI